MLYTVGNKEQCDKDLAAKEAAGGRLFKVGMTGNSRGGIVWQTPEEAAAWLAEAAKAPANEGLDFASLAIYGVEADWARDVVSYEGEAYGRLVVSRPMVKLPEAQT